MNLKKTNTALLTIVCVLLIIVVLVLIKILFSDVKGFEWGSVSDWFSTFGTLGTLLVACIALRNAPDWLAQKSYDNVHNIIEKAIYGDLVKVRGSSLRIKFKIIRLCRDFNHATEKMDGEPDTLNDSITDIENSLDELFLLTMHVGAQLITLSRYNYVLTEHSKNIISEMKMISSQYNDIHERLLTFTSNTSILYSHEHNQESMLSMQEGRDIQNQVRVVHDKLSKFISNIHSQNKPISSFAFYKKK